MLLTNLLTNNNICNIKLVYRTLYMTIIYDYYIELLNKKIKKGFMPFLIVPILQSILHDLRNFVDNSI